MSSSAYALGLPAAAVALLHALMLAAAAFDRHPFWRTRDLNLSEAAALHDAGEVVRLIELGHDPGRAAVVGAGLIVEEPWVLTPLEAAVAEDRPEIVDLLLRHGAPLEPATWTRLRCFAGTVEAEEAAAMLDAVRPPASGERCDGVAIPVRP